MDRRGYLAVLAAGGVATTAGALATHAGNTDTGTGQDSPDGDPGNGTGTDEVGGPDVDLDAASLPVDESELRRAAPRDGIPAIVDPVYARDWSDTAGDGDRELHADDLVLGIEVNGRARAYPVKVLSRHEVVNDDFGGPLLVTYCPVCRSGIAAERRVAGESRTFGVSGFLYNANLVMYDQASESLWSQLLATAIRGPLVGTRLSLRPVTTTTWAEWQENYPDTEVLVPPPASDTVVGPVSFNYEIDIYGDWDKVTARYPDMGPLGDIEWSDTRLRRRRTVLGVAVGDAARAYPLDRVRSNDPVNDVVGDLPVVLTVAADDTLLAYDRRLDGEPLTFWSDDDGALHAGGSRWRRLTGVAQDGPYEGRQLSPVPGSGTIYWAAWLSFHPESTVYEGKNE